MLQRFTQRPVVTAIGIGVVLKITLFLWAYLLAGVGPLELMRGHDGAEYIEFARIIGSGQTGSLPEDVVRHDPGLPLILAGVWVLTGKMASLELCALVLQLAAWLVYVLLFARLCATWTGADRCKESVIAAAAVGYPTLLYYGQFNLTETVFMSMVLASLLMTTSHKYFFAFGIAGLSALVRSTGLLLVVGLFVSIPVATRMWKEPRSSASMLGWLITGLLPWTFSQLISDTVFNANFAVYQPRFGLPFSGFRGISDAGVARSAYIVGSVAFFIAATLGLMHKATIYSWTSVQRNAAAAFAAIFLVFHLCLKTLYYIDHQVYTFDYQDRYLVPLWPLAILVWQRYINWIVASGLLAGAVLISAYWMRNYLAVAGM